MTIGRPVDNVEAGHATPPLVDPLINLYDGERERKGHTHLAVHI